jgi:hypothetical protein
MNLPLQMGAVLRRSRPPFSWRDVNFFRQVRPADGGPCSLNPSPCGTTAAGKTCCDCGPGTTPACNCDKCKPCTNDGKGHCG